MAGDGRRSPPMPPSVWLGIAAVAAAAAAVVVGGADAGFVVGGAGPVRRPRRSTRTATDCDVFVSSPSSSRSPPVLAASFLSGVDGSKKKYTPLPPGLSPFDKSVAKGTDVQSRFRQLAGTAVDRATRDGLKLLELDFPPLVGGDKTKTSFDDFDNLQELDANRDWCVQFAPLVSNSKRSLWLVFPDDKECELAAKEWTGKRFRDAAKFTSIRAACSAVMGEEEFESKTAKAWGSTFASTFNRLTGGDGILADSSYLDNLTDGDADGEAGTAYGAGPRFHLVCQPGNGGPVEDWINVEALHNTDVDGSSQSVTCVVNGALDKVRDGYYPALFFPALAKTVPFYKNFEAALYCRSINDKGLYGWLFRVYPEPWQVILQTPKTVTRGKQEVVTVDETVALVSKTRPSYSQAVQALLKAVAEKK